MTIRHAPRLALRIVAGLIAALTGVIGALVIATPSRADSTCALTSTMVPYGDPALRTYYIDASIKNTGAATSTNWYASVRFPIGTSIQDYWNVTRERSYLYAAADWNTVILPGQSANFGIRFTAPPSGTGAPSMTCAIVY